MSLTERAHELIRQHFRDPGISRELAVDATCGNGKDTEFLARLDFRQVVGFEVQEDAIIQTRMRMDHLGFTNVGLILDGHESLGRHIPGEIDCVMFNLGYLPGGDKNLTTNEVTTLVALKFATDMLSETGIISLICYPGHPQGLQETKAIQRWLATLGAKWRIQMKKSSTSNEAAPILYAITRRKSITPPVPTRTAPPVTEQSDPDSQTTT
ncbi:MAG: methyltransferase domain-containing protein [Gammaproteobacteria bacterium]|nr:methyltransferase domain-containing protein [Gammaproteobacteria bacterium]